VDATRLDRDLLVLDLDEFEMHDEKGSERTYVREANRQVAIAVDQLAGVPPSLKQKGADELSAAQLTYRVARLRETLRAGGAVGEQRALLRKYETEVWRRIAMGLAPLAFVLVGAGLGLAGGRGSRMAAVLTALVVALPVYYPLLTLGEALALRGDLPPAFALNVSNLLLGAGGLLLLGRAGR
jgi:lipopolysaccharide export LptBFGC system permease protein LptF